MAEIPNGGFEQFENLPLTAPPPGLNPDLLHPKWHGEKVVVAASIGVPLMLIMASIRIYAKTYLIRTWALDDYIFLISLGSALTLISLQLALICGGGYGYHAYEVTIADLTKPVLLRSLVLQTITGPLIWLIKLSLFSLIYNAFRPLLYVRRLVWIALLVTATYYTAVAVVNGVVCGPRGGTDRFAYLEGLASPACGDPSGVIQILSILTGVVNLIIDIYLLIIPLRAILQLNLARNRKIGVLLIFMTGIGACVMSVFGLYYRSRSFSPGESTSWSRDITYQVISLFAVSTIEYCVGVIIPCMAPSAKAFSHASGSVNHYLSSRFTGFRRTRSNETLVGDSKELNVLERRILPNGQPFSQTDTIDRMIM